MNSVFSFVIRTRSLLVSVHQRVWDAMYSCILFKSAHHIQSFSTFTRPKVAKKPALLCIMFSSFAFITLLHVFSRHIQSTSTFTRAKVAKKPALLCKMFSSFVVIGISHVLSWTKYGQEAWFTLYMLYFKYWNIRDTMYFHFVCDAMWKNSLEIFLFGKSGVP